MKAILIAILLFLPCLLVLNESNTFVPNIIGIIYIIMLYSASKTKIGNRFCKKLHKENERLINKMF